MAQDTVKLQRWSSAVEIGFWNSLKNVKLDEMRLDESPIHIKGFYSFPSHSAVPALLNLDTASFSSSSSSLLEADGIMTNFNTQAQLNLLNPSLEILKHGNNLVEDILSGSAVQMPSKLNRFAVYIFADLKTHKFHYWFVYPVLKQLKFNSDPAMLTKLNQEFDQTQIDAFYQEFAKFKANREFGFFLVAVGKQKERVSVHPLTDWKELQNDQSVKEIIYGFVDPCPLSKNAGWPLRNFVALMVLHWKLTNAKVLCLRSSTYSANIDSIILPISIEPLKDEDLHEFTGWESNVKGKLQPRSVDLSVIMDPKKLIESSVDLNVRLMRWRMLPSLDVEMLSQTKCLVLGAGTLGCNVASVLMAWGVKSITLLDNGKVSYSNTVRQILYDFDHCTSGRYKAEAAAERLQKIYPGVDARGIVFSIPMPGHPIVESEHSKVLDDISTLKHLILSHDVVFLLTDSRESRWLPTLLCTAHDKLMINAALGFDSFLVMRHGGVDRLGCYFCSDVVAPSNSLVDRTLDQQCTVTRPGLAPMASSLAVELCVSLLHHPLRHNAPASSCSALDNAPSDHPLGVLPHQIRGFLSSFQNVLLHGERFDNCTACSSAILQHYRDAPSEFLLNALTRPEYLEELSGLSALKQSVDEAQFDDFDDE